MSEIVYHRWRDLVGEWRWKYDAPFYYMLGAFYVGFSPICAFMKAFAAAPLKETVLLMLNTPTAPALAVASPPPRFAR
jgi:hypothetical protein